MMCAKVLTPTGLAAYPVWQEIRPSSDDVWLIMSTTSAGVLEVSEWDGMSDEVLVRAFAPTNWLETKFEEVVP